MDLSEVQDVFFEECLEGLDVLESGLLALDESTATDEINSIFRAAHSIKGGAGTFGFPDIASFTHVMETLLDEMRDGRRAVQRDSVDLLLSSVDVLRGMVDAAQNSTDTDVARVAEVQGQLEAMLASAPAGSSGRALSSTPSNETSPGATSNVSTTSPKATHKTEVQAPESGAAGWRIVFTPGPNLLAQGNEPLRIFRELKKLGELTVSADTSGLPALDKLAPKQCFICWTLLLQGAAEQKAIEELFAWAVDDCQLTIDPISPVNTAKVSGSHPNKAIDGSPVPASEEQALTTPSEVSNSPAPSAKPVGSGSAPEDKTKVRKGKKDSGSIRVGIEKVDELINLVGELVITQSMLTEVFRNEAATDNSHSERLRDGMTQLERNTRELQEAVLKIRMLPITVSFSRFPRLVRDLSASLGKNVELKLLGEQTEVDKTVLEKINDPLVHLVRNSLDHGIESPEVRQAAGKPEAGTLTLSAHHEGGDVVIQVMDDGSGLNRDKILAKAIERGVLREQDDPTDEQIFNLIFAPGFSTADNVSDVSGRGVGMDVVRRNIRDLGGNVMISSAAGSGSTVTIRLPLTLAILDGQLASLAEQTYVFPMVSIIESLVIDADRIEAVTAASELYRLRDDYIPIIRLNRVFGMASHRASLIDGLLIVVESEGRRAGLLVDSLQGQQQVVIKSLETNFRQIDGVSGATILGDGTIALIIDVPGLLSRYFETHARQNQKTLATAASTVPPTSTSPAE